MNNLGPSDKYQAREEMVLSEYYQGSKLTFWCTGPLSSAFRFSLDKMQVVLAQIITLNTIKVK